MLSEGSSNVLSEGASIVLSGGSSIVLSGEPLIVLSGGASIMSPQWCACSQPLDTMNVRAAQNVSFK